MRILPLPILAPLLAPATAFAHGGHVADLGGHDHWVLGVGLGVIAGAAVLGWLKGGRDGARDADDEIDAEAQDEASGHAAGERSA